MIPQVKDAICMLTRSRELDVEAMRLRCLAAKTLVELPAVSWHRHVEELNFSVDTLYALSRRTPL